MECTKCGESLDFRETFCSKCGEVTDRGKGPVEIAGRYAARFADGFGKLASVAVAYAANPENRIKVGIGAGFAVLLLISLTSNPISRGISGLSDSAPATPSFNENGTPSLAAYEDVFIGEEVEYVVTGPANIRDFPTSQGTSVIGSLSEGETAMAREVQAFDPDSQWLKLSSGGYVWGANLISTEQIRQGTGSTQQPMNEFPDVLRGRWSSMDTCRGADMNAEIVILANTITFYESVGRLASITYDDRGKPIYQLAMSGEGQTWTQSYAINITANGFSIILDGVGNGYQPSLIYHNPEAGCGHVFFED